MLAIRITRSYQDLIPFFDKLKDFCDKQIIYEHTESSRPHIHGLIVNCKPTTDTLKNWIRSVVGKVEKTDWSFVSKEVNEKFITYMSKGKLEPKLCCGFGEDQVSALRDAWEDRPRGNGRNKIQYILKQENPHQAKKRQIDMLDEITRRITVSGVREAEEILKVICEVVYRENNTIVGRYKIRDYYDMVVYRTQPEDYIRQLKNLCLKI